MYFFIILNTDENKIIHHILIMIANKNIVNVYP